MAKIWEDTDSIHLRVVKSILYSITYALFGWWLVLIRNFFNRHDMDRAAQVCNNVPNGITVMRGVAAVVVVPIYFFLLITSEPHTEIFYWIVVDLFLTDGIDGPLARQLGYSTQFGAKADPVVDKILAGLLVVCLIPLSWHFQGALISAALTGALIWLLWVEQDVARISLRANRIAVQGNFDLHGAYGPGKTKFAFEAAALAIGYGFMTWAPDKWYGTALAILLFVPARWLAEKSRGLHRTEENDLRQRLRVNTTATAKSNISSIQQLP